MVRIIETENVLSVYRQILINFIRDYLNDIPDEIEDEDIAMPIKRTIKKAITPQPKDSVPLALLRMKLFEEYRASIGNNTGIVLVPDNFQAKLHQFPPQLVVGLGEVIGNEVSHTKWTFTIPHYKNNNPSPAPKIPRLHKGNYWARFVLTDNSRVYVNAISEIEGENFIKKIIPLIDSVFLPPEQPYKIDTGKRGGNPIREVNTEPTYAMYYKKPLKNSETGKFDPRLKPNWTVKIEVIAG